MRVADGDTITVLTEDKRQVRVRLDGIDAPERTQPYSQVSRRNLSDMVAGKVVQVHSDKQDKYGRAVGVVRVDGVDAGLKQIKAGLAWHIKRYGAEPSPENRAAYMQRELEA